MDSESKELLEETLSLARDNNKMLHSMRRSMRASQIMSVIYWLIIIGISIGAFYFLQPYVDQMVKLYGNASSVLKNFEGPQK